MQNNPPLHGGPGRSGDTPPPAESGQGIPTTPFPLSEDSGGYAEPEYKKYAPRRKRPSGAAIAGGVLAMILLLAVVIAGVSNLLGRRSTTNATATPVLMQATSVPTTQPGHLTSAFQAAPCPFQLGAGIVDGQQVNCGYVSVPENRNVNDGRKVKLALAIFKAPQSRNTPDPDPVLRLDGGPGGPSLDNWASSVTAANYKTFIFDHDLIMFDQRGTGYSTPSLKCPELISLQDASLARSQQTYE